MPTPFRFVFSWFVRFWFGSSWGDHLEEMIFVFQIFSVVFLSSSANDYWSFQNKSFLENLLNIFLSKSFPQNLSSKISKTPQAKWGFLHEPGMSESGVYRLNIFDNHAQNWRPLYIDDRNPAGGTYGKSFHIDAFCIIQGDNAKIQGETDTNTTSQFQFFTGILHRDSSREHSTRRTCVFVSYVGLVPSCTCINILYGNERSCIEMTALIL